ncbi:hypothetical protein [Zobellia laminariae]|uniref:hypothetical protein n=1 Tax=Zobellia laminariae TaxID=248906 RepID=UPI004055B139
MIDEDSGYSKWRIRYLYSKKVERRKNILLLSFSVTCVIITFYCAYLFWTDEFKFVGKTVIYVNAAVTDEKMIHWGKGYYYQVGVCDYVVDGKKYSSDFRINEWYLLAGIGDTIVIKTVVENPKITKFIGYP